MKKTILLIAALILGATSVNAQKFISLGQQPQNNQKAVIANPRMNEASLKGQAKLNSKATKDAEMLVDFSDTTAYTFGVLSNHTAGTTTGMLRRMDTSATTASLWASTYSGWVNHYWGFYNSLYWFTHNIGTELGNGFALVSPIDTWMNDGSDHTNNTKVYNTYVKCNTPLVTTGWNCVKISFKQLCRKFNDDRYYIDYSTDPTFSTYDSIEFNVKNVEVNTNNYAKINKTIVLPVAGTVNQAALYIRFRFYCPQASANNQDQPSGYFWILDEIQAENGNAYDVNVLRTYHSGSVYHVIPQGLPLDSIYSYAEVENIGGHDFTDMALTESYYTVSGTAAPYTYTCVSSNAGTPSAVSTAMYNDTTFTNDAHTEWSSVDRRRTHTLTSTGVLPDATAASYSSISTLNYTANGTPAAIATGDSISLSVVALPDTVTPVRWARDFDAIFQGQVWTNGRSGYYITDYCPGVYNAGYTVCNRFIVPKTSTGNWYIKGIEIVPGPDSCAVGARVQGALMYADEAATTWDEFIKPLEDNDGNAITTATHTVASEEDLNNGVLSDELTATRQYNSIWLQFSQTIKLDTLQYYACYRLMSNGTKFAVGKDNNRYNFNDANSYSTYVYSTNAIASGYSYSWGYFYGGGYSDNEVPM